MASLKAKEVRANLVKKGFTADDGHHHNFEYWHEGKLIAKTRSSHNSEDIGPSLISAMHKQCKMEKSFFIEFVQCKKSQADYDRALRSAGHIPAIRLSN